MALYRRVQFDVGTSADDILARIKHEVSIVGATSVEVVLAKPGLDRLELRVWFSEHCDLAGHTEI